MSKCFPKDIGKQVFPKTWKLYLINSHSKSLLSTPTTRTAIDTKTEYLPERKKGCLRSMSSSFS